VDQIYHLNGFQTKVSFTSAIDLSDIQHPIIVADKKVRPSLEKLMVGSIDKYPVFWLDATEENKSPDILKDIFRFMNRHQAHRSSTVVGIGGGITTDIAGFIGATYKRGCRLQLVPTSFVGMIDASLGGKAAINFDGIKNCVGGFYPAEKVLICQRFLDTLPLAVMQEGWAEAIKMALISASPLLELIRQKPLNIPTILREAVDVKMSICEVDLHDRGQRRLLNFGHTFAHVIEGLSEYSVHHGTAVGVGMRIANALSVERGLLLPGAAEEIGRLLDDFNIPQTLSVCPRERILAKGEAILQQDKKNVGQITLILLRSIQQGEVVEDVDAATILRHLTDYIAQ